jgi:gas vesicle protein GvpO
MAQRGNGSRQNGSDDKLSGREVIARVRRDLPELLGRPIESVLGLERDDEDDGWSVTVQVVELSRIPHSTDVLGAYAVRVDGDGELVGWRRSRRYHRNQAAED